MAPKAATEATPAIDAGWKAPSKRRGADRVARRHWHGAIAGPAMTDMRENRKSCPQHSDSEILEN